MITLKDLPQRRRRKRKTIEDQQKEYFKTISDEVLFNYLKGASRFPVEELIIRYKELKDKYEPERCEHDGVEGDCAICLEEGKYG